MTYPRKYLKIRDAYAAAMIKAAIKCAQSVNLAYHYVRMYPSDALGIKKRSILKSKTIHLIVMDHDQIQAAKDFKEALAQLNAEIEIEMTENQLKAHKSIWFTGDR